MEYTKGEWKVDKREKDGYFGIDELDKDTFPFIINMPSFSICGRAGAIVSAGVISRKEAEANAYLMAAAPVLYEALEAMLNIFNRGLSVGSLGYMTCVEASQSLAQARRE